MKAQILFLTVFLFAFAARAEDFVPLSSDTTYDAAAVIDIQDSPDLEARLDELARTFETQGTSAVAESMHSDMNNPQMLAAWQEFAQNNQIRVVEVKAHKNEASAIEFMNHRFQRMGLPNLSFQGNFSENRPDPTYVDPAKIAGKKWFRYSVGAGVGTAAGLAVSYLALPPDAHVMSKEFVYLMLPAGGSAVTSLCLEIMFGNPWLNRNVWQPLWSLGGPVRGRAINAGVNVLYGLALYAGSDIAAHLPTHWGHAALAIPAFTKAAFGAITGGLLFSLFMGEYQTDFSTEIKNGSITYDEYYTQENMGVAVNGSGRVVSAVGLAANAPQLQLAGIGVQAGFFMLKTLPQTMKIFVSDPLNDHEFSRAVNPEQAPQRTFFEKCALVLRKTMPLVNLPKLSKGS